MPFMTYWAARRLDDREAYNIRGRTRREAEAHRAEAVAAGLKYGEVAKVEFHYTDRMDLVRRLLSEGNPESALPYYTDD